MSIPNDNLLELGLSNYHGQLVVVEKVDHRVLGRRRRDSMERLILLTRGGLQLQFDNKLKTISRDWPPRQ